MRIFCVINADGVPIFVESVSEATTAYGEPRLLILALLGAKGVGHKEGCLCNHMMEQIMSDYLASAF